MQWLPPPRDCMNISGFLLHLQEQILFLSHSHSYFFSTQTDRDEGSDYNMHELFYPFFRQLIPDSLILSILSPDAIVCIACTPLSHSDSLFSYLAAPLRLVIHLFQQPSCIIMRIQLHAVLEILISLLLPPYFLSLTLSCNSQGSSCDAWLSPSACAKRDLHHLKLPAGSSSGGRHTHEAWDEMKRSLCYVRVVESEQEAWEAGGGKEGWWEQRFPSSCVTHDACQDSMCAHTHSLAGRQIHMRADQGEQMKQAEGRRYANRVMHQMMPWHLRYERRRRRMGTEEQESRAKSDALILFVATRGLCERGKRMAIILPNLSCRAEKASDWTARTRFVCGFMGKRICFMAEFWSIDGKEFFSSQNHEIFAPASLPDDDNDRVINECETFDIRYVYPLSASDWHNDEVSSFSKSKLIIPSTFNLMSVKLIEM